MLEGTLTWRTFGVGHPDGPDQEPVKVWPPGLAEEA
jgi:hypothetical protein